MATVPLSSGGISAFIPEVWAAELLSALRKNLVFGQPGVVNRDYEGEISGYGDTVHVPSLTDPTISDYSTHTDLTINPLVTTDQTLVINAAKAFGFELDDIEARQARNGGALLSEAATRAAYLLADAADQYLAAAMKTGAGTTQTAITTGLTSAMVESSVLSAMATLDTNNVPRPGRWMAISPGANKLLLGIDKFVLVNESGNAEGMRNGQIGRLYGFDVLMTNNLPTGTTYPCVVYGHAIATSYAEQISKVEAFRPPYRFADALKGLHLYGGKVFRGSALVVAEMNGI